MGSIARDEALSRFLFQSNQYKASSGVTYKAFFPRRVSPAGTEEDVSISRIQALSETGIWDLCARTVESGEREAKARADFKAGREPKPLRSVPDEPPERHALVTGWPPLKERQKSLAQQLAAECEGVPRP